MQLDDDSMKLNLQLKLPTNRTDALKCITKEYVGYLFDPDDLPTPDEITNDLIRITRKMFCDHNATAPRSLQWSIPQALIPTQIAEIMLRVYIIKNISYMGLDSDAEFDQLGIYQEFGENEGIYTSEQYEFSRIIISFNYAIESRQITEVMNILKITADRVEICSDRDLVAVNNGIFNYKTKQLEPFSPEYVFIAKSPVDYNPAATINPIIHNDDDNTDWDVETWIEELFEPGSDIPNAIWQIIGAMIRPNNNWGKSVWLVSERGCNGKGSLCKFTRNMIGKKSCVSLSLADFKEKFLLSTLIGKTAIICDENSVGTYIDQIAALKALITGDPFSVDRKFKTPIQMKFHGMMLQCVNEMPRVKDKSESFYRRLIFIPFQKSYTGKERKYIKDDYLCRKEVLEYALYKVLHMDYYEITEPASCENALSNYKNYNDPVRDFLEEILPRATWECLPFGFLYDMYKGWFKINNPNGSVQGRNTFINDVRNIIQPAVHGWYCTAPKKHERVLYRMDRDEPLMDEYDCTRWMANPGTTNRAYRIRMTVVPLFAEGLFKCGSGNGNKNANINPNAIVYIED